MRLTLPADVPIVSHVCAKGHGVKVNVDLSACELSKGDRKSLKRSKRHSRSLPVRMESFLCVAI